MSDFGAAQVKAPDDRQGRSVTVGRGRPSASSGWALSSKEWSATDDGGVLTPAALVPAASPG